jgi:hypothetical protein
LVLSAERSSRPDPNPWVVDLAIRLHIDCRVEPIVTRDPYGDRRVYVSLKCECDWEPEHRLQIVSRDGRTVSKVGRYDGHLTNSAAYNTDALDGVEYHRPG